MTLLRLSKYCHSTMKNIVETAIDAGSFGTLVAAVTAAGLVDTLKGVGPFTVFAPSDDAFAKIDTETLNSILADKEQLSKLLTYHVLPGKVMASDVIKMGSGEVATVNGEKLMVTVSADHSKVMVNNANVTSTDIECDNGVIHVIDTVLVP